MAIGPQILKKNIEKESQIFEDEIDSILAGKKLATSEITIIAPKGMSFSHLNILKPRYISAGWKNVTWNSNQHDGESITFSMTSAISNSSFWEGH